jgi:hypothetical protein
VAASRASILKSGCAGQLLHDLGVDVVPEHLLVDVSRVIRWRIADKD